MDYYPHSGDGANPRGRVISQGRLISNGLASGEDPPTLYITADNEVSFVRRPENGDPYNAISGNVMLLWEGDFYEWEEGGYLIGEHPRTAIAIDETGRKLMIFVVDGRQPNYSEGVTIPELAQIILDHGGYTALNMDGGGSSTLVIEGEGGEPEVLNSPIHERIPGWQRPTGNQFGVYATRP